MTSIELSSEELINAACIPGKGGLYFLGPYTPRITFFSQQVRALRLARALDQLGYLQSGQGIGVVGAGAAGATMAIALALLGHKVTLFDQSNEILHLQSASGRLLHPHIYEWPQLGSLDHRAGLPILDWSAGAGSVVVTNLRTTFGTLSAGLPEFAFKTGFTLKELVRSGDEWALRFEKEGKPEHRNLDHVFLTMGFGEEIACGAVKPEDYWKPGAIGTNATEAIKGTTYVVSGNGDGALTVILGLLIQNFEHEAFTREFLNFSKPDKLREAVEKISSGKPYEADIEGELRATVLPILSQYGVIDTIGKKLRTDRIVTVNSNGPLFAAGKASQLNQCMVLALLEAAEAASIQVTRSIGFVSACNVGATGVALTGTNVGGVPDTSTYKHAILRHGPDIKVRYSPTGGLIGEYEAHIKSLIAGSPQFALPPALDDATFNLFETKRIELFELPATHDAALAAAKERHRIIEIGIDDATKMLVERYTVDLHVAPDAFPDPLDLFRLSRCSGHRIELRASSAVLPAWRRIAPGIEQAPAPSSVRTIYAYGSVPIADCVDACLIRLLDKGVKAAVAAKGAEKLGSISAEILDPVEATWKAWQATLNATPTLRFDFLRWLTNVEQATANPWNGDHALLKNMINALIMIAATHAGEPLTPTSVGNGNLTFAPTGVAIGTGCESVGLQLLSSRTTPDDWDADALILAGANEVIVSDPAGTVMDAGDAGTSIKFARRVRPAIIQNDQQWRARLGGSLVGWQQAVEAEFAAWRERQDAEMKRVSG
jgi:hypothetical protein